MTNTTLSLINPATWPTIEDPLAWQAYARCAETDPESFYPDKGGSTKDAKHVCGGCEVRAECLEYALANDERFGVWGGLSEPERRKLRKAAAGKPVDVDEPRIITAA